MENVVNSYYQGMIQNLYGGTKGCFVCFMQFFYQFEQVLVKNSDFCTCFEKLYQKELQNCQILSQILLEMGGENKFYSSGKKFLSASAVDYQQDVERMFASDIELFEINIIDLKNIINKVDDLNLKNKLKQILKNKKESLTFLKEFYFKKYLI